MHLQCPLHPEEPLDIICLSANCDRKGIICFLCKLEHHNDHDPIVPLKVFVNSFLESKNSNIQPIKEVSQLDQELVGIQDKLGKMKRNFLNYKIVEEAFQKYWKTTVD